MKRVTALFLSVIMVVTMTGVFSFAEENSVGAAAPGYDQYMTEAYKSNELSLVDTVTDTWSVTPTVDTGYLLEMTPAVDTKGEIDCTVNVKMGEASADKKMAYNAGLKNYQLALKLPATACELTFKATAKTVASADSAISLVCTAKRENATKLITIGETEASADAVMCSLISYESIDNGSKDRAYAVFEIRPSADGFYEIIINNNKDDVDNADLIAEIGTASEPVDPEEQAWIYANHTGRLIKQLKARRTYQIRVFENEIGSFSGVYETGIKVCKHNHTDANKMIETDCDYVIERCICNEQTYYEFWLDSVAFSNVVYTGKAAATKATFSIFYFPEDVKEGEILEIPATNKDGIANYKIVITSKDKSSVGLKNAKVVFQNEYADLDPITGTFKVLPKKTNLTSVTANSKGFTAKWKKQATQTSGYQIQYSKDSTFKNAKSIKISGNKNLSRKVSKLKAKTKYYVRVRTYKTVNKKNYYSAWSAAKTVTTKK